MRLLTSVLCVAFLCGMACSKRVAGVPVAPSSGRPPVVRAITYENLEGIAPQEVGRYYRERGVRLSVERPYQPEDVEKAKAALKEFLARRGQPGVQIKAEIVPMPPRSVEIRFTVKR